MLKDSSLMGIFPLLTPNATHIALVNMTSSITSRSLGSCDPWVIPHPSEVESYKATMSLSLAELSYSTIQSTGEYVDLDPSLLLDEELDQFSLPY
jgi:hypothetical protein